MDKRINVTRSSMPTYEEYCNEMLAKAAMLEKIAFETEAKILAEATELTLIEK